MEEWGCSIEESGGSTGESRVKVRCEWGSVSLRKKEKQGGMGVAL